MTPVPQYKRGVRARRRLLRAPLAAIALVVITLSAPGRALATAPRFGVLLTQVGPSSIVYVDPTGTETRTITLPTALSGGGGFEWSPDGRRIAFASNGDIYTMQLNGTGLVQVTHTLIAVESDPTWSPDGQKIAYQRTFNSVSDIFSMNADGTGVVNLTKDPAPQWEPEWSPNGDRILFQAAGTTTFTGLWVMNPDGSSQQEIPNLRCPSGDSACDVDASWSPDGALIAYSGK